MAISYENIKWQCPWELQQLYELTIQKVLNGHSQLHIEALITEAAGATAGQKENVDTPILVYIDDDKGKRAIFKGRLKTVSVRRQGGLYILAADFLSETILLDRQEKSRSFQNTSLTYSDIVEKIIKEYPGKSVEITAAKKKIEGPLIQYQETDWDFIKRLASLLETVLVPETEVIDRIFSFGYPSGKTITLPETGSYDSGKNLWEYEDAHNANPGVTENYFAYYEVTTTEELNMGDRVTFQNQAMQVGAVTVTLQHGLLYYTAKLVKPMAIRQNPIYNEKLQGVTLQGKVLALQNQTVRLHLDIDQTQNQEEAYWYPFAPPTVDSFYLMPQLGTQANLYIPGLKEQNALITGCTRTNGGSCEKTADPNTRYIGTEYGQELKVAPDGVYMTAGKANLQLAMEDQQGFSLKSHQKMILNAKEEIVIQSAKKVTFRAPSQIALRTQDAAISMENEMHFLADMVSFDCSDDTEFPDVEQPAPPPPKPSYILRRPGYLGGSGDGGFNWGDMLEGAKGMVASFGKMAEDFAAGLVYSADDNEAFGLGQQIVSGIEGHAAEHPETASFYAGKMFGDAISAILGAIGMVGSATGEASGFVLDATGGGLAPGIALNVASAGAFVASSALTLNSAHNFAEDFSRMMASSGGSSTAQTSPGGLQKQVEKGQAPKDVDRVDKPHVPGQKPHVHFKDGSSLNNDGTVHDAHRGNPDPSNKTIDWLNKNGWKAGK
jgi:hypothetical protein